MSFSAVASHTTKSIITTTSYPYNVPFVVGAVHYPNLKNDTDSKVFMQNELVSYDFGQSVWKPASDYFWPVTGRVHFFAGSPVVAQLSISPFNGVEADWTIDSMEDGQVDLCFGESTESCSNHPVTVPIVFNHALSQVCFKARTIKNYSFVQAANNTIQSTVISVVLDSVKVHNVINKGHFTQYPVFWTLDQNSTADYTVFSSKTGLELTCDRFENPILNKLGAMLFIPQYVSKQATMEEWHHIEVRISMKDSTTGEVSSDMTYSVPRSSVIPLARICDRWLMDYKYTYHLILGLEDEDTDLNVAVTDWTETREIILGNE